MRLPAPKPDDSPEALYQLACDLYDAYHEKVAVLEALRAHVALWKDDRRMKVMAEILLDDIARLEAAEATRTAAEGRGRPTP